MQIEIIRQVDDWSAWAERWNALLAESHSQVPFLTYDFQRAWWEHLGGGEWQDAELHIVLALDEDKQLVGIAPLFQAKHPTGAAALMPIGSHEIADFLDLIVRPADHEAFCQALIAHLTGPDAPDWQRLDFYNLLDDSGSLGLLQQAAEAEGLAYEQVQLQPSPYIPVPDSFEDYMGMLESKHAHELRRKLRRAARHAVPTAVEIVQEKERLGPALKDFFALMRQEADKNQFLTPAMQTQMDAIARAACRAGWLQLMFFKVGNERVAGYLNFDYDNRIWAYNAGFNSGYAELSPGWLLLAEMIDWCIDNDRAVFDLMRGGEEYKYRFGGVDRFVLKATITRNT